MAAPRRVADTLFRRDMLGPCFGNVAATYIGLLLVEKLSMEHLVPLLVPTVVAMQAMSGKLLFALVSSLVVNTLGFWGVGSLQAMPALLRVQHWKIQVNRSLDTEALWRALPLITFNFFLGGIVAALALHALLPEASSNWHQLPSTSTLARDAVVWLVIEEVMFFYVHRLLHESKTLYAKIHKIHHTWTAPISFVAIYCHPVEHIVSNIVPVITGPILCGSHIAPIGIFFFLGLAHTTGVHSGYWFCDDNGMHDEHHRKFNVNYGVMGIMDRWYGTYQVPPGATAAGEASSSAAAATSKKGE